MPPKQEKEDLSYSESIKEIKKLSSSLQKSLSSALKKLEDTPEETKMKAREERKREEYERCKKRFKFTDKEKVELLDGLVDVFNLDNISPNGYSIYEIGEFLTDNVPDFEEKAGALMEKCRGDIEDLLPPTVTSASTYKNACQELRLHGRRKKQSGKEEEESSKEDATDEEETSAAI